MSNLTIYIIGALIALPAFLVYVADANEKRRNLPLHIQRAQRPAWPTKTTASFAILMAAAWPFVVGWFLADWLLTALGSLGDRIAR